MNFSIVEGRHCVSRVTGPTHNFLGLRLSKLLTERVTVLKLPPVRKGGDGRLDEAQLQAAVIAGVEIANRECGTEWHVTEIAYIADDTPVYSQYELCARAVIKQLAAGKFSGSGQHSP